VIPNATIMAVASTVFIGGTSRIFPF